MPRDILFVCTANKERSVTAEYVARRAFSGKDVVFHSAGIQASEGTPAGTAAVKYLRSVGIDCSEHTSTLVSGELLRNADLVICMEKRQKRILQEMLVFMGIEPVKVKLLAALAGEKDEEIPDIDSQKILGRVAECVLKSKDKILAGRGD